MATIEVYTKFLCPYCSRAKALLDGKGASYREIDVTMDRAGFDAMVARAGGRRTVPQIFVDGGPIGGSDDLAALAAAGGRGPLMGRALRDRFRHLHGRRGAQIRGRVRDVRQTTDDRR